MKSRHRVRTPVKGHNYIFTVLAICCVPMHSLLRVCLWDSRPCSQRTRVKRSVYGHGIIWVPVSQVTVGPNAFRFHQLLCFVSSWPPPHKARSTAHVIVSTLITWYPAASSLEQRLKRVSKHVDSASQGGHNPALWGNKRKSRTGHKDDGRAEFISARKRPFYTLCRKAFSRTMWRVVGLLGERSLVPFRK